MSLIVDEHREFLSDSRRLELFSRAIGTAVIPGSIVLDLASGTGILGLMACRAGAAKVYSIEVEGMIELARGVAAANGVADRVHFVKGLSTEVDLPERVDVVVADQIGNFGFNAGIVDYFYDARTRFLKPGGRLLPSKVDLWVSLVESDTHNAAVDFWLSKPGGFRFVPAFEVAENTGYPVHLRPEELLGPPRLLATLTLGEPMPLVRGRVALRAERLGTLHGIGGWFDAELVPGVRMTNSPLATDRMKRRGIFLPVRPAVQLREGDVVTVDMSIMPRELIVTWTVEVHDAVTGERRSRARHSTFRGMLLNREEVARTRTEFVPVLNARGLARGTVVELCDGKRPLGEIEKEVMRRHRNLFRTDREAAEFVAEVVTRYAT